MAAGRRGAADGDRPAVIPSIPLSRARHLVLTALLATPEQSGPEFDAALRQRQLCAKALGAAAEEPAAMEWRDLNRPANVPTTDFQSTCEIGRDFRLNAGTWGDDRLWVAVVRIGMETVRREAKLPDKAAAQAKAESLWREMIATAARAAGLLAPPGGAP